MIREANTKPKPETAAAFLRRQSRPAVIATRAADPAETPIAAAIETLTAEEREQLHQSEAALERGARAWLEMGIALTIIRDKRLYRETHGTLEAYCWHKFRLERSCIYGFIGAASKYHQVQPIATKLRLKFTAESQFRALRKCEADDLPSVLKLAAKKIEPDEDGNRIPTAKVLAEAVYEVRSAAPAADAPGITPTGRATTAITSRATIEELDRGALAAPRAWQLLIASASFPTDGSDPGSWKGKPCPYATALRALAAILEEALTSLPATEQARRDVFALLTNRAVKLTQENAPSPKKSRDSGAKAPRPKPQTGEVTEYF